MRFFFIFFTLGVFSLFSKIEPSPAVNFVSLENGNDINRAKVFCYAQALQYEEQLKVTQERSAQITREVLDLSRTYPSDYPTIQSKIDEEQRLNSELELYSSRMHDYLTAGRFLMQIEEDPSSDTVKQKLARIISSEHTQKLFERLGQADQIDIPDPLLDEYSIRFKDVSVFFLLPQGQHEEMLRFNPFYAFSCHSNRQIARDTYSPVATYLTSAYLQGRDVHEVLDIFVFKDEGPVQLRQLVRIGQLLDLGRPDIPVEEALDQLKTYTTLRPNFYTKFYGSDQTTTIDPTLLQDFLDAAEQKREIDLNRLQQFFDTVKGRYGVNSAELQAFSDTLAARQPIDPTQLQHFLDVLRGKHDIDPIQLQGYLDALKGKQEAIRTLLGDEKMALYQELFSRQVSFGFQLLALGRYDGVQKVIESIVENIIEQGGCPEGYVDRSFLAFASMLGSIGLGEVD